LARAIDILVVGGGIAGLTAGLAGARLGRRTLVLTGDTLGGHLLSIERIDGYPGSADAVAGYDLCPTVQEQAAAAGAEFAMSRVERLEREDGLWQAVTPAGRHAARSVIVATGTELKALGVPGETLLRGKGVSHCASCDAPLLRDREVVVAGGGDSAMQEALTLAEHVARVTIVHHGESLAGQAAYRSVVEAHPKIERIAQTEISAILGDEAVTAVRLKPLDGGAARELECAAIFVYVGLRPNSSFLDDTLALDESGRIVTDTTLGAELPGLFAAGTVRSNAVGRAAAAAGDGCAAAIAADRFLDSGAA
jgi:thioredoxin reductase (NADPH)